MGTTSKKQHKPEAKLISGVGILLLVVLLVISFSGCRSNANTNNVQENIGEAITRYVLGESETPEDMSYGENFIRFERSSLLDTLSQNASYEITDIQVHDDVADVELTIVSPDVPAIMQEITEEHIISSSDELLSLLETALGESSLTKQYSVSVSLERVNGEWNLIENFDFLNAIHGGILKEGKQIIENVTTDITGGKYND